MTETNSLNIAENKRKIGIMGGTFDPIHYGHLVTAQAAIARFGLEQVIFVPAKTPPHKHRSLVTAGDHRLQMTLLATVTNPLFTVSNNEFKREGYSYTYDTMCEFREQFGEDVELFFITGADAIGEIAGWHKFYLLIEMCHVIAATRPGYDLAGLTKNNPPLSQAIDKIIPLEVPALAISSSDIRQRMQQGEPIKYLVPETVETYIYKYGLYREK